MVTKEIIKSEIDHIEDKYLEALYRIIQSFEVSKTRVVNPGKNDSEMGWHDFIEATYGCLADDPIVRPNQGEFELREELR